MAKFKRKIGTGIHSALVNGKRCRVRPGDVVECTEEELGTAMEDYEVVPQPQVVKHKNLPGFICIDSDGNRHPEKGCMEKEAAEKLAKDLASGIDERRAWQIEQERIEPTLRKKSIWLSGPKLGGHPGNITHIPNDVAGLKDELAAKISEEFNAQGQAVGELAQAKLALQNAWRAWRHQVEIDPMGRLDLHDPQNEHIGRVGYCSAVLQILEDEIAEIRKRIKAATAKEKLQAEDRATRLRFCGISRMRGGVLVEMDGRAVKYPEGSKKPQFADDGMPLEQYLELVKAHHVEKQKCRDAERKAAKLREQQA